MPVKLFFCYAHEDESLLNILKAHLSPLHRQGLIEMWHDRDISAGSKWEKEINKHLNEANIILLLVSPYFMNSDYCYGKELQRALERDHRGEARVIPIILRPVYWQGVLGTLQALPSDGKPVVSSSWHDQDEAFFNVSEGIRKIVEPPSPPVYPPVKPEQKRSPPEPPKIVPTIKPKKFNLIRTLTNHSKGVTAIAISPDGQYLVSGSLDNTINRWNLHTGEFNTLTETNIHTQESLGVWSLAISPDGKFLVSGSIASIAIRKLQTGELHNTLTSSGMNKALAIAADNTTLVSTNGEETIEVWNLSTCELLNTLKANEKVYDRILARNLSFDELFHAFDRPFGEVQSLAISPDGRTFVSGDDENNIIVWNLPKGKLLNILKGHPHTFGGISNAVTSLAFSPDGQTLVSGGSNFTISIWDFRSGKLVKTLAKHAYPVTSIVISPDGHTFVSAGIGDEILLWNLHTGELLNTISNPVSMNRSSESILDIENRVNFISSLAMSPDGQYLVSGNSDSTIQIWGIQEH